MNIFTKKILPISFSVAFIASTFADTPIDMLYYNFKIFRKPLLEDLPIAYCLTPYKNCGGSVANKFCQLNAYARALGWSRSTEKTAAIYLDSKKICLDNCLIFDSIICINKAHVYKNPSFKQMPLAYCNTKGTTCGKAIADRWCRQHKYHRAIRWQEKNYLKGTQFIDSHEACYAKLGQPCQGFKQITCASP